MMSLLDALTTLVVFAIEHDGTEEAGVAQAVTRATIKIETLRMKSPATVWSQCPRCGAQAHAVICWKCRQELPERLARLHAVCIEGEDRRAVDQEILEWANPLFAKRLRRIANRRAA